jgi:hypothetical protein
MNMLGKIFKRIQSDNKFRNKAIFLTLLLCLAMGLGGGYLYYRILLFKAREVRVGWDRLPTPPSKNVELISAGSVCALEGPEDRSLNKECAESKSACLLIRVENRSLYEHCDPYHRGLGSWKSVDKVPDYEIWPCPEAIFPENPRGTISSIEYCQMNGLEEFQRFVLLDDGTIERYVIYTKKYIWDPLYDGLALMVIETVGCFIGLVGGLIIILVTRLTLSQ